MKKLLKILGVLVLIIVIVISAGAIYINARGIPSYERQLPEYTATITPEAVERGKKLSSMLCASCHMNRETGRLTGKHMTDAPPEFGYVYAPNITQDPKVGIGNYTDADLLYLLRTGVKKDGTYAPPYMAKLPNLADEDLNAIIAFLKSDDTMVAADPTPDQPCEPSFLTKMLCNVAFKPFPLPSRKIPMPNEANPLELGEYLVHNLDCFTCHSADFKTINFEVPTSTPGYMGGGNLLLDLDGNPIYSSNITPDKETGIGDWSKEEFVKVLKYGQKDGVSLRYPMIPYTLLTDREAEAIYAYLRTVPAIRNEVAVK
jgi:mono/diheme cytochrome c family protein